MFSRPAPSPDALKLHHDMTLPARWRARRQGSASRAIARLALPTTRARLDRAKSRESLSGRAGIESRAHHFSALSLRQSENRQIDAPSTDWGGW